MGLETGTTIAQLNSAWPLGTDPRSQGDDHLRLIKAVVKNDAASKDATELQTFQGPLRIENIYVGAGPGGVGAATTISAVVGANWLTLRAGQDTNPLAMVMNLSGVEAARFETAGTAANTGQTVITREKGDARYAQLALATLQTFEGPLTINAALRIGAADATATVLTLQGTGANNYIDHKGTLLNFRDSAFTVMARIDAAGTTSSVATTVVTREKGDARYVNLAASGVANAAPVTIGNIVIAGNPAGAAVGSDISSATGVALRIRSGVDTGPVVSFLNNSAAEVARIDPAGTAMADPQSIVTQEKGDARYVSLGGAAVNGVTRIGNIIIGGNPAGGTSANVVSAATSSMLVLRTGVSAVGEIMQIRDNADVLAYTFREAGGSDLVSQAQVVTRLRGDTRYAPKVLLLAAVQALADSATVAQLRDAIIAALAAPIDMSEA